MLPRPGRDEDGEHGEGGRRDDDEEVPVGNDTSPAVERTVRVPASAIYGNDTVRFGD